MDADAVWLVGVLAVGATLYLAVAGYVWSRRTAVGGRPLTLVLLSAGFWTICSAIEVSRRNPATQELWGDLKYLGIVLLPPALLAFAVAYTGRRRGIPGRWMAALLVEPAVILLALAVPAWRPLVRDVPANAPVGSYAVASTGPLFWLHLVYSYVLILSAVALLVSASLRVSRQHVKAWLLIASCLLPFMLNATYNLGLDRSLTFDPTPLAFSTASLVLVWGCFRFRLFDLIPVGRKQVVDRIPDAVLVLDAVGRIADCNPAAGHVAGQSVSALVGRDLQEVLPQLIPLLGGTGLSQYAAGSCRAARHDGVQLDFAVTVSPLPDDQHSPTGRLVVMRDVTAQRDVERRLRELVSERTEIIDTLQRGLYPARLPTIPGLSVAAVLDPAEAETNIGGDFVDVRASGPTRWTLMVGDVVGKGAGAATLTSLARHTTLALASLGWEPSAVLSEVSRAIAFDDQPTGVDPRFCTLALATVVPVEQGALITLSLGGHPRPMLVDANGGVTEVGMPGTLLGVVDTPELHDVQLTLGPGEALVMFTDGVVEARRGADAFGEQRLIELLARHAGSSPEYLTREVVSTVRAFGRGADVRDDVAVLALSVPRRPAVAAGAPGNGSETVGSDGQHPDHPRSQRRGGSDPAREQVTAAAAAARRTTCRT